MAVVDIYSSLGNPKELGSKISGTYLPMGLGASGYIPRRTIMRGTLGEVGAETGFETTSIGLRRGMGSEVESFHSVLSLTKSPVNGWRLPFTSKEFGYKLEFGTPKIFSETKIIEPVRTVMTAEKQPIYDQAVKDFSEDARIKSEIPGYSKIRDTIKTDALMQKAIQDLKKVDKSRYSKLSDSELETVIELAAKYQKAGYFKKRISPSGQRVPKSIDEGILSAELTRSGAFSDVNRFLSPLGKRLLYETIVNQILLKLLL